MKDDFRTMPITAAVYGKKHPKKKDSPPREPRPSGSAIGKLVDAATMAALYRVARKK